MAQRFDWPEYEARARRMTLDGLRFAIKDCNEAVKALGEGPQFGKDANYYRDEASAYRTELAKREARPSRLTANERAILARVIPDSERMNDRELRGAYDAHAARVVAGFKADVAAFHATRVYGIWLPIEGKWFGRPACTHTWPTIEAATVALRASGLDTLDSHGCDKGYVAEYRG